MTPREANWLRRHVAKDFGSGQKVRPAADGHARDQAGFINM